MVEKERAGGLLSLLIGILILLGQDSALMKSFDFNYFLIPNSRIEGYGVTV